MHEQRRTERGCPRGDRGQSVGLLRPDHGRHLWDENTTRRPRPGYGLYDRALGIQYLLGVWDTVEYRG